MFESNPQNSYFDLPFNGNQGLITGQIIYYANDDIVFRLKNGLIVDIYMNQM